MEYDLDQRTAALGVGEFAGFTLGPRDAGTGQGLWRAQLGTQWHQSLRRETSARHPGAQFEVPLTGRVFHRGWTLTLTGRMDQLLPDLVGDTLRSKPPEPVSQKTFVIREIKTVMRALPADEADLRAEHPDYFAQAGAYLALSRVAASDRRYRAELVFLEAGSGLTQIVPLTDGDQGAYQAQLERLVEFLELRRQARERLRHLHYRPAFAAPRPGQETTLARLTATFERHPAVYFEAPTGFGKTGVLLEFALGQLRAGHFDRVLYLTGKSTGQLQVVRQLAAMTAPGQSNPIDYSENTPKTGGTAVAAWHVRNKAEHCVNPVYHCVREACPFLDGMEARWARSGLARFYLDSDHPRDLAALREAGREAMICPYEITRASLAFNDLWIGDYNYVFDPACRGLFYEQPAFNPARTLLILDEAHNLPSRVADSHSHAVSGANLIPLLAELDHLRAPSTLLRAWESYARLVSALQPADALDAALEDDLAHTLETVCHQLALQPPDSVALGPERSAELWRTQELADWLANDRLERLIWCPRDGELSLRCLDAAPVIGTILREYGGIVLASATLSPVDTLTESLGLDLAQAPAHIVAATPWRDGACDVAVDLRVDTSYRHRARHYATTAGTIATLQAAARGPVVVFFPSYAYAESIAAELARDHTALRVARQSRGSDLARQTAWVEEALLLADVLFLVLGSGFAESIDLLGGRVSHAMVVGPALPEVNPVQRARLARLGRLGRAASHRVYHVPGMQKVNQALGRLIRGPGQHAKILLHCRRFGEVDFARLLAPDYQFGTNIAADQDLAAWLATEPACPTAAPHSSADSTAG